MDHATVTPRLTEEIFEHCDTAELFVMLFVQPGVASTMASKGFPLGLPPAIIDVPLTLTSRTFTDVISSCVTVKLMELLYGKAPTINGVAAVGLVI
jgi:hypothetical protein